MINKKEFDKFYKITDPWKVNNKQSRNFILKKIFEKYIKKNSSLIEIGCGEGNFSKVINKLSKNNFGIDISEIAINRAKKLKLDNYKFQQFDLIKINYSKFDVIICLEVLYYLNKKERNLFFSKIKGNKILIFSAPIIGKNKHREYFTDCSLKKIFKTYGFRIIEEKNLNFYANKSFLNRIVNKIFFNKLFNENIITYNILQLIPMKHIYQKVYVLQLNKTKP